MKFQNLNHRLNQLDRGRVATRNKRKNAKKIWARVIVVLLILLIAVYLPVRGIYSSVKQLSASAKAVSAAAKNENLEDIRTNLKQMEDSSGSLNTSLNFLFWVGFIPYFGGYYSDAKKFSYAANQDLQAAQVLVDGLEPYKTELGFTGTPTAGQDRVAQMVKVLDKVLPNLDKVAPELKKASDEVASIDTSKYPDKWGSHTVRSQVETAKNFIIGADLAVTQAKPALEVAPSALGDPTPKTYLILFQNDKELRATGGFMTAYAFVRLDHGHLSETESNDIYTLDTELLQVCEHKICPLTPPAPIVAYLPEADGKPRTAWSMRDSNISPDLPTAMKQFESMYALLGKGIHFDGIITIDTAVVQSLISITGPVDVFGTTYSAAMDKRCNCPNVIYELENYSENVAQGASDRKAILGALMQQILGRVLGSSTQNLPEFVNAAAQLAAGKHMMFYMHDQSVEDALAQLNWTGQVRTTSGDYLMINDSNFAGGKSNLYVTEDVDLKIDQDGKHTLTVKYDNPQIYNTWLNAINRDYFRVYVPEGSTLTYSKGSSVPVGTANELGKTYFDGFIQVRPQNSLTVTLQYTTPSGISGNPYPILIQKQPGTKDFSYTVHVNGNTKSFNLSSDQDLKL